MGWPLGHVVEKLPRSFGRGNCGARITPESIDCGFGGKFRGSVDRVGSLGFVQQRYLVAQRRRMLMW
jgi:hypothetical protein